jgi:hypothetical protein
MNSLHLWLYPLDEDRETLLRKVKVELRAVTLASVPLKAGQSFVP